MIDCIQPDLDEIVITKTSSSVFTTTNIDTVLRNLDVKNLILAGVLTDQCVESAVRDACDLNYLVTLVTGKSHIWLSMTLKYKTSLQSHATMISEDSCKCLESEQLPVSALHLCEPDC